MYYLLSILFGLIVLSVILLRLRLIRPPSIRGIFYGRAIFAHTCAAANLQELQRDLNAGVRRRGGASATIIYPESIAEYVIDSPVPLIPYLTGPYTKGWKRI